MPAVAGRVGRLGRGLHRQDLRVAAVAVLHGVHVQAAEATAERLVLLPVQVLITENQHLPVQPGLIQGAELVVAQGLTEIDAMDLSADVWGKRGDIENAAVGLGTLC